MLTNSEKIQLIEDKLNQVNMSLSIVNNRISSGEPDVPGKPTMEYLLDMYSAIKIALDSELNLLTNLE